MGAALRARARIQVNLAVSQVVDIKQVASFPDIVFPIMWFEDVSFQKQFYTVIEYLCAHITYMHTTAS